MLVIIIYKIYYDKVHQLLNGNWQVGWKVIFYIARIKYIARIGWLVYNGLNQHISIKYRNRLSTQLY